MGPTEILPRINIASGRVRVPVLQRAGALLCPRRGRATHRTRTRTARHHLPSLANMTVYFGWLDYIVFGAMLLSSALIGVYFAFFAAKKQNTTAEYLMGGKTMGMFPISMSLIASYISGISLLGLPAEMYTYGTQLWAIVLSEWLVSLTVAAVYLPVFYNLHITSAYEYLRLRFNQKVRLLGSIIFIIKMMLYIPIVIYVPALAFSQVTGINMHMITPIVCIVCIFYTTLGGLKAVVWTDTLQTGLMFLGVVFVLAYGTWRLGGVQQVFRINEEGQRLEFFNMDLDPTIRHTFWTTVFGNYFSWLASCSVNQAMVQRCLALSSLRRARITIFIMAAGIFTIVSLCCYTGLVIYATFASCDPLATGAIRKSDQLLPYFVMSMAGPVPALPGLFMSGVFSAALSSMSTGLNSLCGVIFEDLIRPAYKSPISERAASFIMKIIVVLVGGACAALVFLVEHLGALVQAGKSLAGITAGSLLGMFSMGLFLPWVNSAGAMAGGVASTLLVGWMSLGTQAAMARGQLFLAPKPSSVAGCPANASAPLLAAARTDFDRSATFFLYRLSYLYYTLVGTAVCVATGLLVSWCTTPNDPAMVHRDLLTPVVHRWLPAQHAHCSRPRPAQPAHTTDYCASLDRLHINPSGDNSSGHDSELPAVRSYT
ncbi:sodium-coupled monocarboxylate transporter 1 isoform X2 [Papilio machaon]|uniref:sodium-coupled monocarboxylate transporter 1 isoform X2 n=1 Tax=Papilio machaon TaxID=76193 RepID=UPI001E6655BF|nr:sodium-coupled monocarboxylate transporter 1 isoform X2 [Papilio machaon]